MKVIMLTAEIYYMIPSLQALQTQDRKKILLDIADALEANESLIMVENEADVAAAQEAGYEKSLISRLALKPGKASTYCAPEFYFDNELEYILIIFFSVIVHFNDVRFSI
jgi:gamma-glutamyl phosphate reductase